MLEHRSPSDRIRALDGQDFDVVVIGGGAVGCSAAREAAAAGYSVLLVEKGDFASGSSSRSSRLLHCGLRYFEAPNPVRYFARHPGRLLTSLSMARQAMQERRELVRTSPERVTPIDFFFPIYADGPYRPWQVDMAFKLLKRLAPDDVPLGYNRLKTPEALQKPMVAALGNRDRLEGAAQFTEYQFNWPERICLDAVLDAEEAGAVALNYTEARMGDMQNGTRKVTLTGQDGARATVRGRRVMAMSGIWIDKVLSGTGKPAARKIFGTKGGHIVIRLPEEYRGQGVSTINSWGEPFYCIPWHDLHYIGPTETPYEGDLDDIHVDEHDLEFLLSETASLFPGLNVTRDKVIRTWAGVRPLTYDPAHPKGSRARELHDLGREGLEGVYAMTAAPVMSHRDSGRKITEVLRKAFAPSGTPSTLSYRPRLPIENSNAQPIAEGAGYTLADVRHAVRHEHARTLLDVLFRRSGVGLRHWFGDAEIARVAEEMGAELGWSEAERQTEIDRYKREVSRLYGVPNRRDKADFNDDATIQQGERA
ncbi:MAG: FAD-dependent oxidoreductase [Roseovarius sp.]|uniref:FAD-dependent oxidoreductase n=1 Tax=Roseovarius sp. TaxID=1486281 RepID=UPI0032ED06B9